MSPSGTVSAKIFRKSQKINLSIKPIMVEFNQRLISWILNCRMLHFFLRVGEVKEILVETKVKLTDNGSNSIMK